MTLDVLVVGGGPAGSSAAAALRRAGLSVTIVESDTFPRFHIGESLLQNANRVFDRIGFQPAIRASGFVPKYGARFVDESGSKCFTYDFGQLLGQAGHTWQVPRAEFDALLLAHAQGLGAEVRQARALAARLHSAGVEVEIDGSGGATRIAARYLVDASGRAGFLARQLGLRQPDPELQKVAAYAHYRGIPRQGVDRRAGDIQIVSCTDMNWFWFIPLPDGVTSVGIVTDFAQWQGEGKTAPEPLLEQALARYPVTAAWTRAAERTSPVRFESTFSYATKAYAGDRWVLAGDAAAFLDPVFSSGVMFAMYGGVDAADAIVAARGGNLAVRAFDRRARRRYEFVRRFVAGFYDPWFRDFYFAPTPKLGLVRAVTGVLAGNWEPSLADRLRLHLFLRFTRMQRKRALVPRMHGTLAPVR